MERWRTLAEFPNYEVSDLGKVRRRTGGKGVRAGRVLRPQKHPGGYVCVKLYKGSRKAWARTVHALVAATWLPPKPTPAHEVDHVDDDKRNNAASNLEWVTSQENKLRAVRSGIAYTGERNGAAKLTDEQVDAIRAACAGGQSQRAVAARFGVSQGHVSDIAAGKSRAKPTARAAA